MNAKEMMTRIQVLESIVDQLLFAQPELREKVFQEVEKQPMQSEGEKHLVEEWKLRYRSIGDGPEPSLSDRLKRSIEVFGD